MNPYCITGLGQRLSERDDEPVLLTTTAEMSARNSTRYIFILLIVIEVKFSLTAGSYIVSA